jgi:hypothetical protein
MIEPDVEMEVIRISGSESDALMRILRALEGEMKDATWAVFDLEGVADREVLGRGVIDLEHEVQQSESGFKVGWNELASIESGFKDIWSFLLIGTSRELPRRAGKERSQLIESADCAIERFDSGDWEVHCRDEETGHRIAALVRRGPNV